MDEEGSIHVARRPTANAKRAERRGMKEVFMLFFFRDKRRKRTTGECGAGGKGRAGFNNKEVLKRVIQVLQHVGVYISLLAPPGRLVTHQVCFEFSRLDLAILLEPLPKSGT